MMMDDQLSCAACHGADGRGGIHVMHMQIMDAPDIRLSALQSDEEESGHGDDHGNEHAGYELDSFYHSVVLGQHPDGDPLDTDMPRWALSDQDLTDLFDFIATLP